MKYGTAWAHTIEIERWHASSDAECNRQQKILLFVLFSVLFVFVVCFPKNQPWNKLLVREKSVYCVLWTGCVGCVCLSSTRYTEKLFTSHFLLFFCHWHNCNCIFVCLFFLCPTETRSRAFVLLLFYIGQQISVTKLTERIVLKLSLLSASIIFFSPIVVLFRATDDYYFSFLSSGFSVNCCLVGNL